MSIPREGTKRYYVMALLGELCKSNNGPCAIHTIKSAAEEREAPYRWKLIRDAIGEMAFLGLLHYDPIGRKYSLPSHSVGQFDSEAKQAEILRSKNLNKMVGDLETKIRDLVDYNKHLENENIALKQQNEDLMGFIQRVTTCVPSPKDYKVGINLP